MSLLNVPRCHWLVLCLANWEDGTVLIVGSLLIEFGAGLPSFLQRRQLISLFIVNLIYEVYLLVSIECVFTEKTAHCLSHCELSLAAQCIVIGLVCVRVCNGRTGGMCGRIDPHQTGFLGKGSDHLQLIKFWPSRTPGKGVCDGAKFFGSVLLQPARSVCVSLSAFSWLSWFIVFFHCLIAWYVCLVPGRTWYTSYLCGTM